MIIYSIYKCVNSINGKVYIGIDKNWPTRRYAHKSKAKLNNGFAFHSAIRKYGWNNFVWEIIYQTKDYEHLKQMEVHFINEHNSFLKGYNQTLGGEGTLGKLQNIKNKKEQSMRRSELNKRSRWYNNGQQNTLLYEHPGEGWSLGRLNQKPTTTGNKWYNNGIDQVMSKIQPDGWSLGMLPKKNALSFSPQEYP
jgi:group I intron endonuclease